VSQENVETVRLSFHAVIRRDKAAWLAMCHPEVETVPLRDFPESAPTRGVEAVWDLFVELHRPWHEGALQPVELIDAGGGKVVAHANVYEHEDRADALNAAGLEE
jgi:ketosteroid isomerase-like protein